MNLVSKINVYINIIINTKSKLIYSTVCWVICHAFCVIHMTSGMLI